VKIAISSKESLRVLETQNVHLSEAPANRRYGVFYRELPTAGLVAVERTTSVLHSDGKLRPFCSAQSTAIKIYSRLIEGQTHFLHFDIYIYIGCPRRNVPDFGRVFHMLKYTDITQNTYVQSYIYIYYIYIFIFIYSSACKVGFIS